MIAASERFLAAKSLLPGCAIALVLFAAASFLASHYSAPVMLYALLPGILTLALNAYAKALQSCFTQPSSSNAAKNEWRLDADQVAMFVEECCERDQFAQTTIGDVYNAYKAWAADSGIQKIVQKKSMRQRLTRLDFGEGRDRQTRYVTGLRIIETSCHL